MDCTKKSVSAAVAAKAVTAVDAESAQQTLSLPMRKVVIPSEKLMGIGNRPFFVWDTSVVPFRLVASIDFLGVITSVYYRQGFIEALIVFGDGARVRRRVVVGDWDNVVTVTSASFQSASARRRRAVELSAADPSGFITEYSEALDIIVMFDPYFSELNVFFPTGVTTTMQVSQFGVQNPKYIKFSSEYPSTLLVSGSGTADEGFVIQVLQVSGSSVVLLSRHTATGAAGMNSRCSGNASKCPSASYCFDAVSDASSSDAHCVYCVVHHEVGPYFARLNTSSGGLQFAPEPIFITHAEGQSNFTVTVVSADVVRNEVYVSFNYDSSPSTLIGLDLPTLLPFYSETLETTALGDAPVVFDLQVNSGERMLVAFAMLSTAAQIVVTYSNLFDIIAVSPNIVDADGSADVTIVGYGFEGALPDLGAFCIFSEQNLTHGVSVISSAAVLDVSTIECRMPPAISFRVCESIVVNIRFGSNRSTARTDVVITRPASAEVYTITTSFGDTGYISVGAAATLTLIGFGFVDSPFATCQLVNASTLQPVASMPCNVMSLTSAVCRMPAAVALPTAPGSFVRYSHDGVTYGMIHASFSVASKQVGIRVVSAQAFPTLIASRPTYVPPVIVHAVDRLGNSMYRFQDWERTYGVLRPVQAEYGNAAFGAAQYFAPQSLTYVVSAMTNGVAVIANATLFCPAAGVLTFTVTDIPFRFMSYVWNVTIIPGRPVYIRVVNESFYIQHSWRVPVHTLRTLQPQLTARSTDVCENTVANTALIPPALRLQYQIDDTASDPETGLETQELARSRVVTVFALVGSAGDYVFDSILIRRVFASKITFTLSSPVGIVSAYTTAPLQTESCAFGLEYAVPGTFKCRPCPLHAICDGTGVIRQTTGFWRSDSLSVHFYQCGSPFGGDACLADGVCRTGYTGPRCSSCADGYGAAGDECVPCSNRAASLGYSIALASALVLCVVAITTLTLRPMDTLDGSPVIVGHPYLYQLRSFVAMIQLLGVIAMSMIGLTNVPTFVHVVFEWLAHMSALDMRVSYISCAAAEDELSRFRVAVLSPMAIAAAAALLLTMRLCVLQCYDFDFSRSIGAKSRVPRFLMSVGRRRSCPDSAVISSSCAEPSVLETNGSDTSVASSVDGVLPEERAAYIAELFDEDVPQLPPSHPVFRSPSILVSPNRNDFADVEGTAPKTIHPALVENPLAHSIQKLGPAQQVSFRLPGSPQRTFSSFRAQRRATGESAESFSASPARRPSQGFNNNVDQSNSSFLVEDGDVDVMIVFEDDVAPSPAAMQAAREAAERVRQRTLTSTSVRENAPYLQGRSYPVYDGVEDDVEDDERDFGRNWYDNDSQQLLDDLDEDGSGDDVAYDYEALITGNYESVSTNRQHVRQAPSDYPYQPAESLVPRQHTSALATLSRSEELAFETYNASEQIVAEEDVAGSPRAYIDDWRRRQDGPRHVSAYVSALPNLNPLVTRPVSASVERQLFTNSTQDENDSPQRGYGNHLPGNASSTADSSSATTSDAVAGRQTEMFETDSGMYFVTREQQSHSGSDTSSSSASEPREQARPAPFNPLAGRPLFSSAGEDSDQGDDVGAPAPNPFKPWDDRAPVEFPNPQEQGNAPPLDAIHNYGGMEDPYWYSFATKESDSAPSKGTAAWKKRVIDAAVKANSQVSPSARFLSARPLRHFIQRVIQAWVVSTCVTLFFLSPAALAACYRMLFCEGIQDSLGNVQLVLVFDRTVSCASPDYKWHREVAVALGVVYALALPLLFLVFSGWLVRVHHSDAAPLAVFSFFTGGFNQRHWQAAMLHPCFVVAMLTAAMLPRHDHERRVSSSIVAAAAFTYVSLSSIQAGLVLRLVEVTRYGSIAIVAALVMMLDVFEGWMLSDVSRSIAISTIVMAVIGALVLTQAATLILQLLRDAYSTSAAFYNAVHDWQRRRETRRVDAVLCEAVRLRDSLWKVHSRTAKIVAVLYPAEEALKDAKKHYDFLLAQLVAKSEELARSHSSFKQQSSTPAEGQGFQQPLGALQWAESEGNFDEGDGNCGEEKDNASFYSVASASLSSQQLGAINAAALKITASLVIPAMERRLKELKTAMDALEMVLHRYRRMVTFLLHLFEFYQGRWVHREVAHGGHQRQMADYAGLNLTGAASFSQRATSDSFVFVDAFAGAAAPSDQRAKSGTPGALTKEEEDAFMMLSLLEAVYNTETVAITATTQLRETLRRLTNDSYVEGNAAPAPFADRKQDRRVKQRKAVSDSVPSRSVSSWLQEPPEAAQALLPAQ